MRDDSISKQKINFATQYVRLKIRIISKAANSSRNALIDVNIIVLYESHT